MRLPVNPTRMELLRLRRRLDIAVRGHKLLKDKQDEMIRRFMLLAGEARGLRMEAERVLTRVYRKSLLARSQVSDAEIRSNLLSTARPTVISCRTGVIMNTKVPQCEMTDIGDHFTYSPVSTPAEMDEAIDALARGMPLLVDLARVEHTVRLLADEIERTRRRVNALECVLIPNLRETARFISMKLNEMERESITRLMKVKEIIRR